MKHKQPCEVGNTSATTLFKFSSAIPRPRRERLRRTTVDSSCILKTS